MKEQETGSKEMAKRAQGVQAMLSKRGKEIQVALRSSEVPEQQFIMGVMRAFRNTPLLLKCTNVSIFSSVMQCAEAGLIPSSLFGHCYLIPIQNRKRNCIEATFRMGYQGYLHLARKYDELQSVVVKEVYINEYKDTTAFDYSFGFDVKLFHKPLCPSDRGKDIILFYGVFAYKDGRKNIEFMWKEDIDKIKKTAQSQNIWEQHYIEMAKKTVIRRYIKTSSLSKITQKVVGIEEMGEVAGLSTVEIFADNDIIDLEAEDISDKTKAKSQKALKDVGTKTIKDNKTSTNSRENEVVTMTNYPGLNHVQKQLWTALLELYAGNKKGAQDHLEQLTQQKDIYSVTEGKALIAWEETVQPALEKFKKENGI